MIIFGVDPGTARIGWSLIQSNKSVISTISYGCITTQKEEREQIRLLKLHDALRSLINKYKPQCLAVEALYFATNAKTAISVGQARGVILLTAAESKLPVSSYSPLAVKRTICGDGKADKKQVERMVIRILKLKETPALDDTSDALAIALTHAYSYKLQSKLLYPSYSDLQS